MFDSKIPETDDKENIIGQKSADKSYIPRARIHLIAPANVINPHYPT